MEILELEQGSPEWLKYRLWNCCASEAPMMMGASPYMSRNQLLALKKGWQANPIPAFTQKLFDDGHEKEAEARPLTEDEWLLDPGSILPIVARTIIDDDLILSASLDGWAEPEKLNWEHKLWNEALAENVRNGIIEPRYYWQLEQIAIVTGVKDVYFTVSDGTGTKRVSFTYTSTQERQDQVIAGWKQFLVDLESYELTARDELVETQKAVAIKVPDFAWSVDGGGQLTTNLADMIPLIRDSAHMIKNTPLENDADFIARGEVARSAKAARGRLNDEMVKIESHYQSLSVARKAHLEVDGILQKLQADSESKVTTEKQARKNDIIIAGKAAYGVYMVEQTARTEVDNRIALRLDGPPFRCPDFTEAVKGKRTLESMQNEVDQALADAKAAITPAVDAIVSNLSVHSARVEEYKFLFLADLVAVLMMNPEACRGVVDGRIAEHQRKEAEKEAERDRIKEEERQRDIAAVDAARRLEQKEDAEPEPSTEKPIDIPLKHNKSSAPARAVATGMQEEAKPKGIVLRPEFVQELEAWRKNNRVTRKAVTELRTLIQNNPPT